MASTISSKVTSPAVPPYSSTTIAICMCFSVISENSAPQRLLSGTKYASRITSFNPLLFGSEVPMYFSKSLIYTTPTTLSGSSSYTGILEYPSSIESLMVSCKESSKSTQAISVRWVIMSATSISSNSKMLLIISFCTSSITPFSCPTSTIIRISSSVTSSSSAFGSIPNNRTTALVETERIFTNGLQTLETNSKIGTTANETCSDFCMAIFFGASSPKTSEK